MSLSRLPVVSMIPILLFEAGPLRAAETDEAHLALGKAFQSLPTA